MSMWPSVVVVFFLSSSYEANPTDFSSFFCRRELTMKEVYDNIPKLLNRRTKAVLISIGVTDIRRGLSLRETKRFFTGIFQACQNYNLVPLVTTILSTDTNKIHNQKVEIFNRFIHENFTNVLDMWKVACFGFESALSATYNGWVICTSTIEYDFSFEHQDNNIGFVHFCYSEKVGASGALQHHRRNEMRFAHSSPSDKWQTVTAKPNTKLIYSATTTTTKLGDKTPTKT